MQHKLFDQKVPGHLRSTSGRFEQRIELTQKLSTANILVAIMLEIEFNFYNVIMKFLKSRTKAVRIEPKGVHGRFRSVANDEIFLVFDKKFHA